MPAHLLVIAPVAKTDLKDIYQHGLRQWRQIQFESYLESIKEQFWILSEQPIIGVDRSELLLDARSLPIESHAQFYRVAPDTVEIIRLLHARQDPQRHLG